MHLKEIHIHGFKSFAEPTTVELGLGLSVFIGPNGAGKSNICDAIRWALGESRTREVRGQRAEDLIFRGSQGRRSAQMAEVALTFQDDDHRLDLPGSEVTVTRRSYRSGDVEIRLNDRAVRLKDVTRLFLGTGLGALGYAFIAQGHVETVLTEGPDHRRLMVEEAAGALVYRQRRTEALAELAHADAELQRTIEELALEREREAPLLGEVHRLESSEELRRSIFALETALAQKRMKDLLRQIRSLTHRADRERAEALKLRQAAEAERDWEGTLFEARQAAELAIYEMDDALERVEALLARQSTSRESQGDRLADLEAERAKVEDHLQDARIRVRGLGEETAALRANLAESESRVTAFRSAHGDRPPLLDPSRLESVRSDLSRRLTEEATRLEGAQSRIKKATAERAVLEKDLAAVEVEGRALLEAERRLEAGRRSEALRRDRLREALEVTRGAGRSLRPGPRSVLEASEAGRLRGVIGPLGSLIRFDDSLAEAVHGALGSAFDNLVVEREEDAEAAIRFLRENRAGRGTFLALDRVRPVPPPEGPRGAPGYLGVASELVSFDEQVRKAVALVLGRTFVAETLEAARAFSRDQGLRYRWVTLDGDLLSPGGAITGGDRETRTPDLRASLREAETKLARTERELAEAQERIRTLTDRRAQLRERRDALDDDAADARREADSARFALEAIQADLAAAETLRPEDLAAWRDAEESLVRLTERIQGREGLMGPATAEVAALEEERKRILSEIEEAGRLVDAGGRRADELAGEAESLRGRRTTVRVLKEALTSLDRKLREHRIAAEGRAARLEDALQRADDELVRLDEERESTRRRLEIELGVAYDEDAAQPPADAAMDLSRLRASLEALGPVNPAAREEAGRVQERIVRLEAKREDAILTKERLVTLASEADQELERRWRATLAEVDRHFGALFEELFEGGEAHLAAGTRGLDITAAPPGKHPADLDMLSGGERSLVALAFLLALSELNPTPFLLLDEVEAALDEANSRRLLSYLDRHRKDRQYLVITHQRMTMEWADVLVGVTMEVPGVSKLVEIRLEEADRGELEAL